MTQSKLNEPFKDALEKYTCKLQELQTQFDNMKTWVNAQNLQLKNTLEQSIKEQTWIDNQLKVNFKKPLTEF